MFFLGGELAVFDCLDPNLYDEGIIVYTVCTDIYVIRGRELLLLEGTFTVTILPTDYERFGLEFFAGVGLI